MDIEIYPESVTRKVTTEITELEEFNWSYTRGYLTRTCNSKGYRLKVTDSWDEILSLGYKLIKWKIQWRHIVDDSVYGHSEVIMYRESEEKVWVPEIFDDEIGGNYYYGGYSDLKFIDDYYNESVCVRHVEDLYLTERIAAIFRHKRKGTLEIICNRNGRVAYKNGDIVYDNGSDYTPEDPF